MVQRSGNAELLNNMAKEHGFRVTQLNAVEKDGQPCSSSRIRQFLQDGKPEDAATLLGQPHTITGRVISGDARARTLGYPTANLKLKHQLIPAYGAYVASAYIGTDPTPHPAAVNIGIRPTFNLTIPLLEAHLLNHHEDFYGQRLHVSLHRFLRPEQKFPSLEALRTQIEDDCARVKAYFTPQHTTETAS
ncbi:MAG: hypothetical protein KDD76_06345 [Rickettsiales bacterium]|nr:hypothetical protein [Rickettsiales bacterium]